MSKEANPLPNDSFETEKNGKKGFHSQLNGEIQKNKASAAMNQVLRYGRHQNREHRLSFFKRFRISL